MASTFEQGERRHYNRERAERESANRRDIVVGVPRDWPLRIRLEKDIFAWLQHYFAELFFNPFNPQQKAMCNAILHAARYGGDQAIGAPRGEGKTSLAECVTIYCVLRGYVQFPLIVAANGPDAQAILANIKRHFEINDELHEQYPEVCDPIWALEGSPQRASMQTCCGGHRTRLKWGQNHIVFPDVPDRQLDDGTWFRSQCRGSVLMTRGLDSAIRGIRYGTLRPDLVLIDDPETRESAESDVQISKRIRTIEEDIGGLGGPRGRMGRLMLCTLMNRQGVAYQYTDPPQKPSWRGIRYKLLVEPPENTELWAEYVELRRSGMAAAKQADRDVDDAIAEATQFYADRREAMDAGAVVANPHRFDPQTELSALQRCYNIIADLGDEAFQTEYQNDPPETAGPEESGVYPGLVASRLSGLERGVIPPNHPLLTAAIDVGKTALHWCVVAWSHHASGSVIDYGVQDVWPKNRDNDQAVEQAILQALYSLREQWRSTEYCDPDGEILPIRICLVDSGYKDNPVYEFCRSTGQQIFRPAKGFGETSDDRRKYFRPPDKDSREKRVGDHCALMHQAAQQLWLVMMDSDYWKSWLHQRFLTPEDKPGSMTLHGNDKRDHVAFSHHICAEIEVEEFVEGKGLKRYWKKVNRNNHWLDTTYMACVGASLHGAKLLSPTAVEPDKGAKQGQKRPNKQKRKEFIQRPGGWMQGGKP